jgi:hypothetical protein
MNISTTQGADTKTWTPGLDNSEGSSSTLLTGEHISVLIFLSEIDEMSFFNSAKVIVIT